MPGFFMQYSCTLFDFLIIHIIITLLLPLAHPLPGRTAAGLSVSTLHNTLHQWFDQNHIHNNDQCYPGEVRHGGGERRKEKGENTWVLLLLIGEGIDFSSSLLYLDDVH